MTGAVAMARALDARRVRAAALGAWSSPPPPSEHPTDASLVALLADTFDDVDDAHDRLRTLERRLRDADDRRAVFPTIYTRMTDAVRTAIAAGDFDDAAWMHRYTVTFADYYRRAFVAFERGEHGAVPPPWRVAFETAVSGTALVAQDAFLGIHAHINYDLALTLRDVGIDPERARKRADHDRIDGVLTGLIDAQQAALADLYAPGLATLDASIGRVDETLSLFSMTEGRAWAWRVAAALTDAGWSPVRRSIRWLHRTTATGGALFVRSPPIEPSVLAALHRTERERPSLAVTLDALADRLDAVTVAPPS
jgi:hypothetical protein